jgi:hypothetical protein
MVTSLRSKWAVGAIRRGTFRRVFATCGTVGTRPYRAIRARTSHGKRERVQTSEFGVNLQRTSGSAVELRTGIYSQPNGH